MQLSLARKLYGTVGIILVLLVIVSVIGFITDKTLVNGYKHLEATEVVQVSAAKEAAIQLGFAVRSLKNQVVRKDTQSVDEFKKAGESIRSQLKKFDTLAQSNEEKDAVKKADETFAAFEDSFNKTVEANKTGADIAAVDSIAKGTNRPVFEAFDNLDKLALKNLSDSNARLEALSVKLGYIPVVAVIAAFVIGLLFSSSIIRRIMAPITEIASVIEGASERGPYQKCPCIRDRRNRPDGAGVQFNDGDS